MNKRALSFLLFFLIINIGFTQNQYVIDSIQNLINATKEDSTKINLLNDLSWELITIGNYTQATQQAEEALELSEKTNSNTGKALSLNTIGIVYWYQGDYPQALEYEYKVLKLSEESGDKRRLAGSLNNIGNIYNEQGDFEHALEDQLRALKIYEELNAKSDIANVYNNIAVLYRKKNNYDTSLDYHYKALKIREEANNENGIAESLNNIGVLHYEQKEYDKALEDYTKALKIFERLGDKKNISNLLINIGNNYFKQKKYNEALSYQNQSLTPAKEIGYKEGIKEAEKSLSEIYQNLNDNANALAHYKNYVDVRDSIFNDTKSRQIAEMRTKYELNQKEKEIALLTNEKKLQQIQLYSIIIGLLLIAIIAFVLYSRNNVKQKLLAEKQKLILEKQLIEIEQRALLLQMNPHFIFNSLSSIGGLIYEDKPQIAVKYLTMFSKLMRLILEYSLEQAIPLSKEIELLRYYIELEQFRFEDKFDFNINIDPAIPTETNIPPMLIQPHVENAILHGLNSKQRKGLLEIKMNYINNAIVCEVKDNGIGREQAKQLNQKSTHKSMATGITQKRIDLINQNQEVPIELQIKDMKTSSGEACGTVVKITIPIQ